jgi:tetratricopeptide (TPR) repeat protein
MSLALLDIEEGLKAPLADASGYLAIKGHIYTQLGNVQDALSAFEEVRRLREGRGDNGRIGEALADLGLIHLKMRNFRQARHLLTNGIKLLEDVGNFTFAIRARKRLAFSHLTTGHPVKALRELYSAYDAAQEHGMYGQITPIMETIHKLGRALGVWSHKMDV